MARLISQKLSGQTLIEVVVAVALLAFASGLAIWISGRVMGSLQVEKKTQARETCRMLLDSPDLKTGVYDYEQFAVEVFVTPSTVHPDLKIIEIRAADEIREWYTLKKTVLHE